MVRTGAIVLGLVASCLAVLHGIITLNPFSLFEGGLLAVNSFVFAPDSPEKKH